MEYTCSNRFRKPYSRVTSPHLKRAQRDKGMITYNTEESGTIEWHIQNLLPDMDFSWWERSADPPPATERESSTSVDDDYVRRLAPLDLDVKPYRPTRPCVEGDPRSTDDYVRRLFVVEFEPRRFERSYCVFGDPRQLEQGKQGPAIRPDNYGYNTVATLT